MLSDHIRVEAFRQAIAESATNNVVVDVGAGTGLLSIMAALSGAKKVIGIEYSEIVKEFRKAINRQKVDKVVKIMHILAEEAPLDKDTVDVIVSEWMGYFLIFERMLPSVLNVRDRCLKPGGLMISGRGKIFLACMTKLGFTENELRELEKDQSNEEVGILYFK